MAPLNTTVDSTQRQLVVSHVTNLTRIYSAVLTTPTYHHTSPLDYNYTAPPIHIDTEFSPYNYSTPPDYDAIALTDPTLPIIYRAHAPAYFNIASLLLATISMTFNLVAYEATRQATRCPGNDKAVTAQSGFHALFANQALTDGAASVAMLLEQAADRWIRSSLTSRSDTPLIGRLLCSMLSERSLSGACLIAGTFNAAIAVAVMVSSCTGVKGHRYLFTAMGCRASANFVWLLGVMVTVCFTLPPPEVGNNGASASCQRRPLPSPAGVKASPTLRLCVEELAPAAAMLVCLLYASSKRCCVIGKLSDAARSDDGRSTTPASTITAITNSQAPPPPSTLVERGVTGLGAAVLASSCSHLVVRLSYISLVLVYGDSDGDWAWLSSLLGYDGTSYRAVTCLLNPLVYASFCSDFRNRIFFVRAIKSYD